MKIFKRIILILIVAVCMFGIMPQNISKAKVSTEIGNITEKQPSGSDLSGIIGKILGFLQVAAGLTSVLVIAFTGFNYIVASTPDMKKEIQNKMLPIVIGLVLLFGAVSISKFIVGSIEGTTTVQEANKSTPV